MGRARGRKGDRGTGEIAPGRGAWPPELEDLQRRGGMSPDWHDMWHGRGQGLGEVADADLGSSMLFVSVSQETLHDLRERPFTPWERAKLFEGPFGDRAMEERDPFVQSLWMQERMRMQDWADQMGMRVPWQELEPLWREHFRRDADGAIDLELPPVLFKYSLWSVLFLQNSSGSLLSEDDKRGIRADLEMFSMHEDFPRFVREELLPVFAQEHHTNRFWLYEGDLSADFHNHVMRGLLPSRENFAEEADPENFLEKIGASGIWNEDEQNRFRFAMAVLVAEKIAFEYNLGEDLDSDKEALVLERSFEDAFYHVTKCYLERISRSPVAQDTLRDLLTPEQWQRVAPEIDHWQSSSYAFRMDGDSFDSLRAGEITFGEFIASAFET